MDEKQLLLEVEEINADLKFNSEKYIQELPKIEREARSNILRAKEELKNEAIEGLRT